VQLAQIEAFVEVARAGTMRRAGEVLHLGQPALSARIRGLEEEIGQPLFERRKRGMAITAAGRAFLSYAERVLGTVDEGLAHLRAVGRDGSGDVVLGAAPAVSAYVLPEVMVRLRRTHPGVRIQVRTGHSEEVVSLVAAGEVGVGLVRELRDRRVRTQPIYEEDLVLVVRRDHPFAYDGRIEADRLREATVVLFDRASSEYVATAGLLREAGLVPAGLIEVDNIETAKRMAQRGLGVAFLPTTAVADAVAEGSLVRIEVVGMARQRRRIVAAEPLDAVVTPELGGLRELIRQIPAFIPGTIAIRSAPEARRRRAP